GHGNPPERRSGFPQSLSEFQELFPHDAAYAAYLDRALACRLCPAKLRPDRSARGRTLHLGAVGVNRIGTASSYKTKYPIKSAHAFTIPFKCAVYIALSLFGS